MNTETTDTVTASPKPLRVLAFPTTSTAAQSCGGKDPYIESVVTRLKGEHPDVRVDHHVPSPAGRKGRDKTGADLAALLEAGGHDVLIVPRLPQISREACAVANLVHDAVERGMRFISVAEGIDTQEQPNWAAVVTVFLLTNISHRDLEKARRRLLKN